MMHFFTQDGLQKLKRICHSKTLFAFDYDGTLTPLTPKLSHARVSLKTKKLLEELHQKAPIAIVSGRSIFDLKKLCSFMPTFFIGNHGLEGIAIHQKLKTRFRGLCKKWKKKLIKNISGLQGVELEDKKYSLAIHYRQARDRSYVKRSLWRGISELSPFPKIILGKSVINLLPPFRFNKGISLRMAMQKLKVKQAIYIGDDQTDEDVFRLPQNSILKIRVGRKNNSHADFYLKNHFEINRFLNKTLKMNFIFLLFFFFLSAMAHGFAYSFEGEFHPEKTYALIITGSPEEENRNITRLAFETFKAQGIPRDHIWVIAHSPAFHDGRDFDGDGRKDIDFPLEEEAIETAFAELGARVPEDGQVVIYINSHGFRRRDDSFIYLYPGITLGAIPIELSGQLLNDYVTRYFKEATQKIIIVQACKSGGFADSCSGLNRTVVTSSNHNLSYRGPIDGKYWPKFSYHFFKAFSSGQGDLDQDGVVTIQEAFVTAYLNNKPTHLLHRALNRIGVWGDDDPVIAFGQEMAFCYF
ncbi:MAG: trehalose-phosphatase [Deltaproteobacteria bacterium]|nr:trehalose-phosphatase [Deltaproteobacteria bacterium]